MTTINAVLIAGAGSVGLTVAERIFSGDPACVSILAKGGRLERYRDGLFVNGRRIGFRFGDEKPVDLVIIACKFYHLDEVIEDIRPYIKSDTIILSLLNGISSEEIIGKTFGRERLPLAMILGTDAFHRGTETVYTRPGVIHFGDAGGNNGEREKSLAEFFSRVKVPFELQSNMRRMYWYKFMINVGVNQITAALRLPYGAIQTNGNAGELPEARSFVEMAMREVIAVANAEGIDLNEGDFNSWYKTVNALDAKSTTSMCQDVLAERKTEVEIFALAMMDLGKKHRVPVPVNETLYLALRVMEKRYGIKD
ncbi:MAG: ketopantoate reductase family protein [Treponema sp.]|jgi:2-dehydropantoate 2-reductase|nr:ketopantoate reductase family protein [Treponema sp.]